MISSLQSSYLFLHTSQFIIVLLFFGHLYSLCRACLFVHGKSCLEKRESRARETTCKKHHSVLLSSNTELYSITQSTFKSLGVFLYFTFPSQELLHLRCAAYNGLKIYGCLTGDTCQSNSVMQRAGGIPDEFSA